MCVCVCERERDDRENREGGGEICCVCAVQYAIELAYLTDVCMHGYRALLDRLEKGNWIGGSAHTWQYKSVYSLISLTRF